MHAAVKMSGCDCLQAFLCPGRIDTLSSLRSDLVSALLSHPSNKNNLFTWDVPEIENGNIVSVMCWSFFLQRNV